MAASGSSIVKELNPKTRPSRAGIQNAAGGLSTVMAFDGSRDAKSNAVQFFVPDWMAAA